MRWLVWILLFIVIDLSIYVWLHRDIDNRLHDGVESVSNQVFDFGRIQEKVMFQR